MPLSRKVLSEEYMVKDLIRSKLRFITIINERGLKSISKNMQSPRQRSFPHFARLREAIQTSFLHFARHAKSETEVFLTLCTSARSNSDLFLAFCTSYKVPERGLSCVLHVMQSPLSGNWKVFSSFPKYPAGDLPFI